MSLAAARSCELAPHKIYGMGFPIMRESSAPFSNHLHLHLYSYSSTKRRPWNGPAPAMTFRWTTIYTHFIYTHARTQHFTWRFGVYVCERRYIGAAFAYMQSSSRERTIRAYISYVLSPEHVHPSPFLSTVRHRVYHIFYTHHAV